MRLIVARCQVTYAGRLSTILPEAVRLLMVGPDGTFMVWADGGGVKPLNWMTPPNVLEEQRDEHGELTGLKTIVAYFRSRGEKRTKVLTPDSSHGTNPASAAQTTSASSSQR